MWFAGFGKPAGVRTRKRRHDRYVSDLLDCSLGNVLDLSASGMRVGVRGRCPLSRGQVTTVTITAPQGSLTLQATVVRVVRRGFRTRELGLEFIGMKPRTAAALKSLAQFGFAGGGGGIAGSFVGSREAGGMGGGPRVGEAAMPKPARMKIDQAREALGVTAGASVAEIRAAYRKLARKYHPDARPGPEAAAKFIELAQAYRLLRGEDDAD
jgi:DnaJ-domain-containing protein 1